MKYDKCPKCGGALEEDPEDSSEMYCPECNYGWRFYRLTDYKEKARKWLFDYGGSSGFSVSTLEQLATWIEKAEKLDKLLVSMSEDLQLEPEDFLERKEKAEKWDESQKPFDIAKEIDRQRKAGRKPGVFVFKEDLDELISKAEKWDKLTESEVDP
jgi:hypothetical protein